MHRGSRKRKSPSQTTYEPAKKDNQASEKGKKEPPQLQKVSSTQEMEEMCGGTGSLIISAHNLKFL